MEQFGDIVASPLVFQRVGEVSFSPTRSVRTPELHCFLAEMRQVGALCS